MLWKLVVPSVRPARGETTSSRGALSSGNCCVNVSAEESSVDWHEIVIESAKYSLTDLEDAINKAVERKLNVTQLLHLELNEQAWSAGLHQLWHLCPQRMSAVCGRQVCVQQQRDCVLDLPRVLLLRDRTGRVHQM